MFQEIAIAQLQWVELGVSKLSSCSFHLLHHEQALLLRSRGKGMFRAKRRAWRTEKEQGNSVRNLFPLKRVQWFRPARRTCRWSDAAKAAGQLSAQRSGHRHSLAGDPVCVARSHCRCRAGRKLRVGLDQPGAGELCVLGIGKAWRLHMPFNSKAAGGGRERADVGHRRVGVSKAVPQELAPESGPGGGHCAVVCPLLPGQLPPTPGSLE